MRFDVIKPDEIRVMYEQAADKATQVTIMSQLMCCEEADICDLLGIPHTKKRSHGHLDEKAALEMHKNGATNEEIAEALGVTAQAVYHWKCRSGINKLLLTSEETLALFRELYDQGFADREIAEKTGEETQTVCIWRKQNKLKAHSKRIYRDWERDDKVMRPLYEQGLTDEQIAAEVGCLRWTVRDWRKKYELAANQRPRKNKKNDWAEIDAMCRPLYDRGLTDPEVAAITGIDRRTVCNWRKRFGLQSQRSLQGENLHDYDYS